MSDSLPHSIHFAAIGFESGLLGLGWISVDNVALHYRFVGRLNLFKLQRRRSTEDAMNMKSILQLFGVLAIATIGYFLLAQFWPKNVSEIAQFAEAGAVVFVAIIARDIKESIKSRHLEGITYVRNLIGTPQASDNRRWVYKVLRTTTGPLNEDDDQKAREICRDFDHIGLLCRQGLLPMDVIAETYGRNIVDMWNRLGRFVANWRKESEDPVYFLEFERLAARAEHIRRKLEKAQASTAQS